MLILAGLLPPLLFFLLFLAVYAVVPDNRGWTRIRITFLYSSVVFGVAILLMTELLSSLGLVTARAMISAWILCSAVVVLVVTRSKRPIALFTDLTYYWSRVRSQGWLAIICFVLGVSLVLGIMYPPNNHDSMTYHLARVAHWQQNGDISYYPTHILRQLDMPPFAEYMALHFYTMTGTDRFANMVQLFFFLGCILAVSLLTQQVGGSPREQKLAALFTALLPMGILQSSTTQNDIVLAYFILCFACLTNRFNRVPAMKTGAACGVALGLAILTKGTAYLYALPFAFWYVLWLFRRKVPDRRARLRSIAAVALIPVIALALNSTFYIRNLGFSGSPLGFSGRMAATEGFDPRHLILNTAKNVMCHLPVSSSMENGLRSWARTWRVDIDDPRFNYTPLSQIAHALDYHEDYAQNLVHLLLIAGCTVLAITRKPKGRLYRLYLVTLFCIALLFCLLLKWQPWGSRLQAGLFMLFCVMLGVEMGRLSGWWRAAALLALGYFALYCLFRNPRKPLWPLEENAFNRDPYHFRYIPAGWWECSQQIIRSNYTHIGLVIGQDSWDYGFYHLLGHPSRRLEHVLVRNPSNVFSGPFRPEVIISEDTAARSYHWQGDVFSKEAVFKGGPALYRRR